MPTVGAAGIFLVLSLFSCMLQPSCPTVGFALMSGRGSSPSDRRNPEAATFPLPCVITYGTHSVPLSMYTNRYTSTVTNIFLLFLCHFL